MPTTARDVSYSDGDTSLSGVLVTDSEASEPRPGVLLVHGGAGLDTHARAQAERYAALGYEVVACDMYGPVPAGDREAMRAVLMALRDDVDTLVQRAQAGIAVLAEQGNVNGSFGAVGFCFGGMTVITVARAGVDLRGVVSMHGSFKTPRPAHPDAVTARVLACHGAIDPHVPMTDVAALVDEMENAHVDYQVNVYGGAMHGFTHTDAVPGAIRGVEYNERADRRSFAAATAFFREVFAD
jgi:dienelactone hydrolase